MLGGNTVEEWLQFAHTETLIECHVHPNVQCAGAAIYRANVLKKMRHSELLVLPKNHDVVFSTPDEFKAHHEATPER